MKTLQALYSRIGKDKASKIYREKNRNSALKITDINPPDGGFLSKIFNKRIDINATNNYEPFPATLPIIVEDDTFLYPFMITPIFLNKKEDIDAITYAMDKNSLVFITTTREGHEGSRELEDINRIGVIGSIMRKVPIPDGRVKVLFQGLGKGEITSNELNNIEIDDLTFQSSASQ